MSYIAYLCYPHSYDLDVEPVIKFEEPEQWAYSKVVPIQFSVLQQWT